MDDDIRRENRKNEKYIRVLRIAALLILLGIVIYAFVQFKKNPELATPEACLT